MFLYLISLTANYTEVDVPLDQPQLLYAKNTSNGIEMKVSADRAGLIKFNTKNPNKNWSFEFTFEDINLSFPEKAGIYLWYTKNPIKPGKYLGVDGKSYGIFAGIVFLGRRPQLVIGSNDYNENEQEINDIEDMVVLRDNIHPERFRNVKNFRMKIISTEKNFKIEIYENNKMLYDYLRFYKTPALKERGSDGYFSISAEYNKHVPQEKKFIVKNIKLYNRMESDDYDRNKIYAPPVNYSLRFSDEVNHSNPEIQHLIANFEHLMKYLEITLGTPEGRSIIKNVMDTYNSVEGQSEKIENIDNLVTDINNNIDRLIKQNSISKMDIIDKEIMEVQRSNYELKNYMKEMKIDIFKTIRNYFFIVGFGISLLCLLQYWNIKRIGMKKYMKE